MKCFRCGGIQSVSIVEAPHHTRLHTRREPKVVLHNYQWYNCSSCGNGWAERELVDQHIKVSNYFFGCVWRFRGYISDFQYSREWRFGDKEKKLLHRLKRGKKRFPPERVEGYPYVYRREPGTLPSCFHPVRGRNWRKFEAYIKETV